MTKNQPSRSYETIQKLEKKWKQPKSRNRLSTES